MDNLDTKQAIEQGAVALGIELGSTTIKAVLTTLDFQSIASGSYAWENNFQNGLWTYPMTEVWKGMQEAYTSLKKAITDEYGVRLTKIQCMGVSAMMHGYLAFNNENELLVPFRTWRNATTGEAAAQLTELFNFNIPQRWSIAHLYQAILNQESHVQDIRFLTTLAGYVHWQLTGQKVLGIGDASGMFPINPETGGYDQTMMKQFQTLEAVQHCVWKLENLLPIVLPAGVSAGNLTEAGAKLLDPTGELQAGSLFAPPEGDAGTGMVATNSVNEGTGNISVGTSIFSMIVLQHSLSRVYTDIDIVTTPTGLPVAMVHANNSSSDIDAWVKLFGEFAEKIGADCSTSKLYATLLNPALNEADPDAGGLVGYGYYSGENITDMPEGRPLLVRQPTSAFTIGNLMRLNLFTAFGAVKLGMRILADENVRTKNIVAQGGLFKTPVVAQKLLAAALDTSVTVMNTAGEGGAWGMAMLAIYASQRESNESNEDLGDFLENKVFAREECVTLAPDPEDVAGFNKFMDRYVKSLDVERAAIKTMPAEKSNE